MKVRRVLLLYTAAVAVSAQARFDVSSVRPAQPDAAARDARFNIRGDRFEVKAATVGDILDFLGGFQLYRVVGGPPWMRTDRYDIQAKANRGLTTRDDRDSAVMALLAERFRLEAHKEKRDVPGFVLRLPRTPPALKLHNDTTPHSPVFADSRGDIVLTGYSMSGLANYLSQLLRGPVVDETALKGVYDFTLPVSEVSTQPTQSYGERVREGAEAFGFRIEEKKIPLEVTVVDRLERPSEN